MSPEQLRELKRRHQAEEAAAFGQAKVEFKGNTFTEAEREQLIKMKKAGDSDGIKKLFESKGIKMKKRSKSIKDEHQKVKEYKLRELEEKKVKSHSEKDHDN